MLILTVCVCRDGRWTHDTGISRDVWFSRFPFWGNILLGATTHAFSHQKVGPTKIGDVQWIQTGYSQQWGKTLCHIFGFHRRKHQAQSFLPLGSSLFRFPSSHEAGTADVGLGPWRAGRVPGRRGPLRGLGPWAREGMLMAKEAANLPDLKPTWESRFTLEADTRETMRNNIRNKLVGMHSWWNQILLLYCLTFFVSSICILFGAEKDFCRGPSPL